MGENEQFSTLPYADDFCLVTTDLRTHQKILNKIAEKINSMGMKIKPSKCRSFSIRSGKPSSVHFIVEGNIIPTIQEEEQKFLGRVLFFEGKSEDCFNLIKQKLEDKMTNLDNTLIRNEFKL